MSMARLDLLKRTLERLTASGGNRSAPAGESRGREAASPAQIPTVGWMDVLWRAWTSVSNDNRFLVAGGVTYAVLVALFPALAAFVSIYGLLLDPSQVEKQMSALSGVLPDQSRQLLADELHKLVSASSGTLGLSAFFGFLLALWSASRGMSGLISALNIAYEENEKRGFFKLNLLAVGLPSS
jgi:membrane protein